MGVVVVRRKHPLAVMVFLYESGNASTSDVIRFVGGHPSCVIGTLRTLESLAVGFRWSTASIPPQRGRPDSGRSNHFRTRNPFWTRNSPGTDGHISVAMTEQFQRARAPTGKNREGSGATAGPGR